jgi:hypothetical protein
LWLVWINDRLLRLVRCVGVHIDDLGTSIPNFAVPEFENPAVLENIPRTRAQQKLSLRPARDPD